MIIRKRTDSTGNWAMHDNKRGGTATNVNNYRLYPNLNSAESTSTSNQVDLLSNGFKCRASNNDQNASGGTYVYMAFAEAPFVNSEGVPCTAR